MEERTPEIAKEYLEHYKKVNYGMMPEWVWDMAIKVLEQESSGDTVSRGVFEQVMWERDVAVKQLKELGYELGEKPKTGHWIPLGNYDDYGNECSYKCSECGDIDTYDYNFCPNCGAKMVEPQESEEV